MSPSAPAHCDTTHCQRKQGSLRHRRVSTWPGQAEGLAPQASAPAPDTTDCLIGGSLPADAHPRAPRSVRLADLIRNTPCRAIAIGRPPWRRPTKYRDQGTEHALCVYAMFFNYELASQRGTLLFLFYGARVLRLAASGVQKARRIEQGYADCRERATTRHAWRGHAVRDGFALTHRTGGDRTGRS